jgi:hypothetical protein
MQAILLNYNYFNVTLPYQRLMGWDLIVVVFGFQSTPVGSLQTGHEIVVSPNRDRHPTANKVYKAIKCHSVCIC